MPRTRRNFVHGVVDNNPLSSSGTTLISGGLAALQAVSGGDVAVLVLDPLGTSGNPEIVHVTAHTASATSATILRGQEGTSSRVHPQGTRWRHVPTVIDWNHQELANRGPNDHHAQSHAHNGADGSGTVSFANLTNVPQLPQIFQQALTITPTSGTTELVVATLNVPAFTVPTRQVLSASGSINPDTDGSTARWRMTIRSDNVSGTVRHRQDVDMRGNSGAGGRYPFALVNAEAVSVAASTAAVYVLTIVRLLLSGTAEMHDDTPRLSCLVLQDFS